MKWIWVLIFWMTAAFGALGQTGTVKGRVYNAINNQSIEFTKVQVVGLSKGSTSNIDGKFEISGLEPGIYSFKAFSFGFEELVINDITVTNSRVVELNFPLVEEIVEQKEVKVTASPFYKRKESPVSLKTLSSAEIERLPGANRDVSKVLQALPGVASRASFRNDVIIRGGAPGENRFYLDGIEVPNINHFATQGSSGGPVGLLNVNFIREVDFYAGAFPSNYANGLSSVISFKQKDGNKDALLANVAVGSSDVALTLDGPIGKKTDFIFSARRSYLQFLFAALKLPFLPTYNDAQFKVNHKINNKNKISFIGLGALDDFVLNEKANDGVEDVDQRELNQFFLGNIPAQDQWNYTFGIIYTHYCKNSYQQLFLSRNMLKNNAQKYSDNVELEANKILDYTSFEAENKVRFENTWLKKGYKVNAGLGYEYARYFSSTFNRISVGSNVVTVDFQSDLFLSKAAAFGQVSKSYLNERLDLSLGLRTDISNYSSAMTNPLNQLSPMFSASYALTERWSVSGNVARYHQLPSYTILGFRDQNASLVNRKNDVSYLRVDQLIAGVAHETNFSSKFSVEGFYKLYSNYPFSVSDSISLANLGSDFGIVGNEEVSSSSEGRSYGIEFLYQQKLVKGFYGIVAYTYVTSEFLSKNGEYIPSSWDSKNIVSITGGKRFKKGWEVGFRWLFSGGAPYTPVDVATSSLKEVWDVNNSGVLDYNLLNTQRETNFHQLNVRVDKRFDLEKVSLNIYFDVQNAYGSKTTLSPILLLQRDAQGNPMTDPNDPNRYATKFIENKSGIVQPTLGIIFEFKVKKARI